MTREISTRGYDPFVAHKTDQVRVRILAALCQWTRCNKFQTAVLVPTSIYVCSSSKQVKKKRYERRNARITGIVFSNVLERYTVPREVVCHFLRNTSSSFPDRQPGNDPYEMVLRAGTEQYTSCAPVRPWGSKVQRRDCIGSAKEQTSTDTLYLHDFMSNQPALPRANCLFLKPI